MPVDPAMTTVLIISAADRPWVAPVTKLIRDRGMNVVCISTFSIVGILLASRMIAAVFVDAASVATSLDAARERASQISPATQIIVVARDDPRTPTELAALV